MSTKTTKPSPSLIQIDASHKPLGRLASEVALLVRGKKSPAYAPNKIPDLKIVITNLEKIGISEKKLDDTFRKWFTRYPGGLKSRSWRESFAKNPKQFFLLSVRRMLPDNKLRNQLLKHITFA